MKNITNKFYSLILDDKDFLDKIKYNNKGYYAHNYSKGKKNYKVTVVIPVFNGEKTIVKTIESIITQSIGFGEVELLIVDDKSEDETRTILLDYSKKYSNIFPVFLNKNTGSPSVPRNLGIELARGNYIMFVDADDWLNERGLEVLYNILEKTGDNYAIGKTIKVDNNGQFIIGEYNSWSNRESINPFTIKHLFHHLGPTARMMRTKLIKEKGIKFPNMKFAEDKHFFIDILTQCGPISTSNEVIYYANRRKDNKGLTTTTSIFEKTDANISVIKYVIEKKLPTDIEKMILNRLYEFDCITRLFDRMHFLRSNEKEKYFEKFSEVLLTTRDLSYDFTELFFKTWHKTLVELFREGRFDDIVKLISWNIENPTKEYHIIDNNPYYKLPFNDHFAYAPMNILAIHHKSIIEQENLLFYFKVYGKYANTIEKLIIRQRNNDLNQLELQIQHHYDNIYKVTLPFRDLSELESSSHSVFIKYLDYMKTPIKMNVRNIVHHDKKKIDFYTTTSDNFGVNIK